MLVQGNKNERYRSDAEEEWRNPFASQGFALHREMAEEFEKNIWTEDESDADGDEKHQSEEICPRRRL